MSRIAELIDRVLASPEDAKVLADVKTQVVALARAFPLYS